MTSKPKLASTQLAKATKSNIPISSASKASADMALKIRNSRRGMTYAWYCHKAKVASEKKATAAAKEAAATKQAEKVNIPFKEGDKNTCDECNVELPAGPNWPALCDSCEIKVAKLQKKIDRQIREEMGEEMGEYEFDTDDE